MRSKPGNLGAWPTRAAGRELSSMILVFCGRVFYVRTEPGNLGAWPTRAAGRGLFFYDPGVSWWSKIGI